MRTSDKYKIEQAFVSKYGRKPEDSMQDVEKINAIKEELRRKGDI